MRLLASVRVRAVVLLTASAALYVIAVAAAAGPITINDPPQCTSAPCAAANATPFPSSITVSGAGAISSISVSINGFWHDIPADVDMLLESPGGQSVMLMSDAGDTASIPQSSPISFSFADSGTRLPSDDPNNPNGSTLQTNMTYKPADYDSSPDAENECVLFPAPITDAGDAFSGTVATLAGLGTTANGVWNLKISDDCGEPGGGGGAIGSWCLVINGTLYGCAPTAAVVTSVVSIRTPAGVRVAWQTASEARVAGFNLYRLVDLEALRVNRSLIPAKQAGTARGASYRYLDRRAGRGAQYRLQIVHLDGTRSWAG